MGGDVAPRAGAAVAIGPVVQFLQRGGQARRAAIHAVEHVSVAQQLGGQGDQVVGLPVALNLSLAGTDPTADGDGGEKTGIPHRDLRRRARSCSGTETVSMFAVQENELALFDAFEFLQQAAASQAIEQARFGRGSQVPAR